MAYSTPLNRTAPNLLRQPFVIAALASVGIHGLLAANFERISLFPRTADLPPSVQLVELSPSQISRLYPSPPQQLSLGTITAPPSLSSLGPSPTLPEFPATLSTPSFPSFPTSPTVPAFPPSSSRLPSIPSSPGISSFPVPTTPIFPPAIPIPNELPTFPTEDLFKDKNSQELEKLRDRQLAFENLSPEDRAILENMQPDVVGANIFNPQLGGEEAEENYGIPPQRYTSLNPNTDNLNPEETPVDPENFRGSLLADLQQSNQSQQQQLAANSETSVTPAPTNPNPMSAIAAGNDFIAWVDGVSQEYPNLETKPPTTISSVYPAEACQDRLSGTAIVGVAIGAGGEVLRGPELLSDTGYSVLDNAAMAKVGELTVTQLSAEAGSQPTAYWYAFDFNPDNCGMPQPATEDTLPPAAPLQQTLPVSPPPQPQQQTPIETPTETQPPVEETPVETQPPVEMTPEMTPPPFEGEDLESDFTPTPESTTPPEPQLENTLPPTPSPVLPEVETQIETQSEIPPTEPTEHKGSLLDSLTTPYSEP